MSNKAETSTKEEYNFSFTVDNPALVDFTHLKLFNGFNEIVKEGYGNMEINVPRGAYQLRIEMNEHVEDRNYRLTENIKDSIKEIEMTSSIPVEGFTSTHEYFAGPSSEWSQKSTMTGEPLNRNSIFLFLRYADNKTPFEDIRNPIKGFFILNENREVIHTLDETNTKTNSGEAQEYFGSIAFHMPVTSGQYYLAYKGKEIKREIPLYVFDGWQTQVFIMIKDIPLFGSTRMSIEKNGFSWQSEQNVQLDALIQKMYNEIYVLPESLKNAVAMLKWDNPMLAIIASYMYLLTEDTKDDTLFTTILHNLQTRILKNNDAPDLVALRLLGAIHFKQEIPKESLNAPCMVLAGMNAFLKQSLKDETLIKKGSVVEKVFPNLRCDSIWTTYEPLPIKTIKAERPINRGVKSLTDAKSKAGNKPLNYDESLLNKTIKGGVSYDLSKDWITSSIFSQLTETNQLDIAGLASQLQVTANTITQSLNKLSNGEKLNSIAKQVLGNLKSKDIEKAINKISGQVNNLLK